MSDFPEAWFARRTYDARTFSPGALAERKAAAGVTVSVVLPARNEAATVAA
ncbi:MAG: glucosyl-3-phosphoglycerate synthase, partial [Euzebyales bacterium]|nr:glucosyl-3-phosphoglycerate synthase [Euzebyales bacterium]